MNCTECLRQPSTVSQCNKWEDADGSYSEQVSCLGVDTSGLMFQDIPDKTASGHRYDLLGSVEGAGELLNWCVGNPGGRVAQSVLWRLSSLIPLL